MSGMPAAPDSVVRQTAFDLDSHLETLVDRLLTQKLSAMEQSITSGASDTGESLKTAQGDLQALKTETAAVRQELQAVALRQAELGRALNAQTWIFSGALGLLVILAALALLLRRRGGGKASRESQAPQALSGEEMRRYLEENNEALARRILAGQGPGPGHGAYGLQGPRLVAVAEPPKPPTPEELCQSIMEKLNEILRSPEDRARYFVRLLAKRHEMEGLFPLEPEGTYLQGPRELARVRRSGNEGAAYLGLEFDRTLYVFPNRDKIDIAQKPDAFFEGYAISGSIQKVLRPAVFTAEGDRAAPGQWALREKGRIV